MVPASVIPVVGAALIWVPGALFLFFKGNTWAGLGMLFWGIVVIGAIDNLVKPYLMRGARYTPTIFTLFAIMGGIAYFGTIGFILGPLILSFLVVSVVHLSKNHSEAGDFPCQLQSRQNSPRESRSLAAACDQRQCP